jgi:hypothetical protein
MSDQRKIRLTPIDPYFTIEIDFSEDIEHIREQIEEKQRGPEKEEEEEKKGVSPDKEAAPPAEEANPITGE